MSDCAAAATSDAPSRESKLKGLIRRLSRADQTAASLLYGESSEILYALSVRIVANAEERGRGFTRRILPRLAHCRLL